MSDFKDLSKDLPCPTTTFQVDVEGELTKKKYVGEFECRIPRRKERCLIDKHRAALNGDFVTQLDPSTLHFHHMIAYLRYTLIGDYPKFWKESDLGYELYDSNVVEAIYSKVLDFEEKWLAEVWGEDAVKALREPKDEKETGSPEKD